jgi:hypothetical protein
MTNSLEMKDSLRITGAVKRGSRYTVIQKGVKKHLSANQLMALAYSKVGDTCCTCCKPCNPILSNYVDEKGLYCDMCV